MRVTVPSEAGAANQSELAKLRFSGCNSCEGLSPLNLNLADPTLIGCRPRLEWCAPIG